MKTFTPFLLPATWQEVLQVELQKPYIASLAAFIEEEYLNSPDPIYPPKELIFNAFYQTPFNAVKVALIGQDPYHGPRQAHGLSFSVSKGIKPPPSLQNMFTELEKDLAIPKPSHGCLLSWAEQGVLLLNSILTVRAKQPLSHHKKGWEQFTDAVVSALIEREDPVIFLLWGKSAQDKCKFLPDAAKLSHHFILKAAHPSPYSAQNGFFGCKHFSKVNQILQELGKTPIDWTLR